MGLDTIHQKESFGRWKIEGELEEQLNMWQRKVDKLEGEERMWRIRAENLEEPMAAKRAEQDKELKGWRTRLERLEKKLETRAIPEGHGEKGIGGGRRGRATEARESRVKEQTQLGEGKNKERLRDSA